jgi:hypothetical protein
MKEQDSADDRIQIREHVKSAGDLDLHFDALGVDAGEGEAVDASDGH